MSRLLCRNKSIELLEPYEGKLSRTVLRGERGSNALDLPDATPTATPTTTTPAAIPATSTPSPCVVSTIYGLKWSPMGRRTNRGPATKAT